MKVRRSLVVNETPLETRIALLENGQLCELFIERTTQKSQVGYIYKGKVTKILQGLQSAFVDIGETREGFLYLNESENRSFHNNTAVDQEDNEGTINIPLSPYIFPSLRKGDIVLVQIIKDSIGNKGPRLSRFINLPGRFLVFMPKIEHIGISRKIINNQERERLRTIVNRHLKTGEGLIVRTAAMEEKEEDLVNDIIYLRNLWTELKFIYRHNKTPSLVWKDLKLLHKVMRDLFNHEVINFWVDNNDSYHEVKTIIRELNTKWSNRIKLFNNKIPIFEAFAIEKEIDNALQAKTTLERGGSLVINQTEALVSIDVNTGKYVGKNGLEETAFITNMEAIPEIVRQLRLRNLGGIIVIDFIDMSDSLHREELMKRLQEELERDRNHSRIIEISDFGLVEMTRKRTGPNLEHILTSSCPHCDGSGRIISAETAVLGIYREMTRCKESLHGVDIKLTIHSDLSKNLRSDIRNGINTLIKSLNANIVWAERTDGTMQKIEFDISPLK